MNKATILLPFVMSFEFYHSIEEFVQNINMILIGNRIKSYQFGYDGDYLAVFYSGKRPTPDVIRFLARNNPYIDYKNVEWTW